MTTACEPERLKNGIGDRNQKRRQDSPSSLLHKAGFAFVTRLLPPQGMQADSHRAFGRAHVSVEDLF